MRVIREYWQCAVKQEIPVKELLDTVDTFLGSHGYPYRRLWSPTHPELSDTELKALFKKIPRPCNPDQVEALFEDVGWFGGETVPMEYTGHQPFLSNGVRVVHCAGTSFCHVHFYMEVTDLDGPARIRDESAVAAALKEQFPKVRREEDTYCLWSPEEAAGIAAANEALAPTLAEVKRSLPPFRERTAARQSGRRACGRSGYTPRVKSLAFPERSWRCPFFRRHSTAIAIQLGAALKWSGGRPADTG